MGMPLELNTMIVTKGNEKRVTDNIFQIEKKGYRLYPLDIPLNIHKTKNGECIGTAVVPPACPAAAHQASVQALRVHQAATARTAVR